MKQAGIIIMLGTILGLSLLMSMTAIYTCWVESYPYLCLFLEILIVFFYIGAGMTIFGKLFESWDK